VAPLNVVLYRLVHFYVDPNKVAFRVVDGEAVLIQTDTSYYYSLNAVGTFIWEQLTQGRCTADELAVAVSQEFAQPKAAVVAHIHALLADLKKEGLVVQD
jgi:hypothetical protein